MRGLDICEAYFHEHGEPMLKARFPELLPHIAVGLIGSGSECYGFDDAISRDHDFDLGFCLFLPDEEIVSRHNAFRLERELAALPKEFKGQKRLTLAPTGGARRGVLRLSDFLREKTGTPDGVLSARDFFFLPESALAEVTNGKVFFDGSGRLTEVRRRLSYLPEDVRRKKLAGTLLLMGQAGQYNYPRSLAREDTAAAQLSIIEFAKHALHSILLLHRIYLPYYKWRFRTLAQISPLADALEFLISSPNDKKTAKEKRATITDIATAVGGLLCEQGLSLRQDDNLEAHAYAVNDAVASPEIRNLHILYGV